MISSLISLVISLAVLYCFYLLINWILGFIGIIPPVFRTILYVIFAVIAFVIIVRFLGSFLGGSVRFPF